MKVLAFIVQRSFARYVAFDLGEAARRLGWGVHWVDLDALLQEGMNKNATWRSDAIARVSAEVRDAAPDVLLSYGLEAFARPFASWDAASTWTMAEAAGAPVACFLFDFGFPFDTPDAPDVPALLERLRAPDVALWCWDTAAIDDLARLRIPSRLFPMAVNDAMFAPPSAEARDLPVVFSGGPTPERVATLERLAPLGLSVYGYDEAAWRASPVLMACHRGLVAQRHAMREVYQRARIAVNVTRAHGRSSLNMRVYEAMACGCLVLTDQGDAARAILGDGCVVSYASLEELESLTRHYLAHEDERRAITARAVQIVREQHTYVARLSSIGSDLRHLMVEGRAWRRYLHFHRDDPAKAARFVAALRAEGVTRRTDVWPVSS